MAIAPTQDLRRKRRPQGMTKDEVTAWHLSRTKRDGECLTPEAARNSGGYPMVSFEGRAIKMSRLVLEARLGRDLVDGEYACHTCDRPACVNPEHLYAGTAAENAADMVRAGHAGRGRIAMDNHRVTIQGDLYQDLRRYMVEHQLPSVRAALEDVLRGLSRGEGHSQQEEVLGEHARNGDRDRQEVGSSQHAHRTR